jgi:hypothetical protein
MTALVDRVSGAVSNTMFTLSCLPTAGGQATIKLDRPSPGA